MREIVRKLTNRMAWGVRNEVIGDGLEKPIGAKVDGKLFANAFANFSVRICSKLFENRRIGWPGFAPNGRPGGANGVKIHRKLFANAFANFSALECPGNRSKIAHSDGPGYWKWKPTSQRILSNQ